MNLTERRAEIPIGGRFSVLVMSIVKGRSGRLSERSDGRVRASRASTQLASVTSSLGGFLGGFSRPLFGLCVGLLIVVGGCSSNVEAGIDKGRSEADPVTTIFVPGVTGSKIRDSQTGEILWGTSRNLLGPRDGGYPFALSIVPGDAQGDSLEAFEVFDRFKLAGLTQHVYGSLFDALESVGFLQGTLGQPKDASADLLGFPYDWRRDNVDNAIALGRALEALRLERGEDELEVDLICQSNGTYLCRWLMKYGLADLETAEQGRAKPLSTLKIRRVVMIANANGGSIRILRELDRGRKYIPGIGRRLQPETLFTFRSLFQDLPAYRDDLFIDQNGEPLAVDLYDAQTWKRFGWSIFDRDAVRRIEQTGDRRFGSEADRMAFLSERLSNAQRFQELIGRAEGPAIIGTGEAAPEIYLIQGRSLATPDRAVLVRNPDESEAEWDLLFTGDRKLRRWDRARTQAGADGDEHATVTSQTWLAPDECRQLAAPTTFVEGTHFKMILRDGLHRHVIEALQRKADRRPATSARRENLVAEQETELPCRVDLSATRAR